MACEHKFIDAGLIFGHSIFCLSGSGGHARHYYQTFRCERCLHIELEELNTPEECSYADVNYNARPASHRELCVLEQRFEYMAPRLSRRP
jgi:hypothetical protein